MTTMSDQATAAEQLEFLAGEARKVLAIFDRMDLRRYFEQVERGEPIALAIQAASEHLAPALRILGLDRPPEPNPFDSIVVPE